MIRREPNGPDLFAVRPVGATMTRRSYAVSDARTGSPIGTLVPAGSDWKVHDETGTLVAHIVELEQSAGRARYVANADGREICRFVWGFLGMTVSSAELQIEFLPDAGPRFTRALAIALAPVLEHRARRASQWRST